MKHYEIDQIFQDTAYIRTGGSPEELKCAQYIQAWCERLGYEPLLEPFQVQMSNMEAELLLVDGQEIPCKGYLCSGSCDIEAPLYYLPGTDPCSLSQCRGKIVMIDGRAGYWRYQDLVDNGAVGYVTYCGDVHYADEDIDRRELRAHVSKGRKIPGMNINAKHAVSLIRKGAKTARFVIQQEEYTSNSHNVVLDLPGEIDEYILLTAHYDSTSLSVGTYDNMSGSVGLMALADHFSRTPHRYGLRFVWCGSEERGLLGSKAYAAAHEEELAKVSLNVNLDMIGSIMGKFIACCTSEEKLVHYLEYLGSQMGFGIEPYQGVYPSDATPFADKGIPALSFARLAEHNTATIHNRYDTANVMSTSQMLKDISFITTFVETMANACRCPVGRIIPEKMKEKLDIYNTRKRGDK